jgi:hypothetical protein
MALNNVFHIKEIQVTSGTPPSHGYRCSSWTVHTRDFCKDNFIEKDKGQKKKKAKKIRFGKFWKTSFFFFFGKNKHIKSSRKILYMAQLDGL